MVQICKALSQIFTTAEHLALEHLEHSRSSKEHNEVSRTEWRKLLTSFSKVKTLRVNDGLAEELSCCIQSDHGESPLELLPELQELRYSGSGNSDDAFTSFIDARQKAGSPVTPSDEFFLSDLAACDPPRDSMLAAKLVSTSTACAIAMGTSQTLCYPRDGSVRWSPVR
jgi:hypothetical protein